MPGDERVQPGDALQPLRQPGPGQPAATLVLQLDIVVILSPVVSDEQHPQQLPPVSGRQDHSTRDPCDLMIKCSRRGGHGIPSAVQSPANRRAHGLSIGLRKGQVSVSADPSAAAAAEPNGLALSDHLVM